MAIASTAAVRTRLTSFRDVPASERTRSAEGTPSGKPRRVARRVGAVLLTLLAAFTLWFSTATPSDALVDDILAMCGPVNVPAPEARGTGLEAFFDLNQGNGIVSPKDTATYIPGDNPTYPAPSYHRYGMAGLTWNVFGWDPGCFSVNRYINFVPNLIFNVSKTFATFTMALIGWSFGKDPFSFLNTPVGNVAKATSDVAGAFLGLVGVLGGVYLGLKNWGPNGRVTAVLKGVGWMGMIAGLFFWFAANPTAMGSKINSLVGGLTSTGYESLSKLPTGTDNSLCNGSVQNGAGPAACVQDALWTPLVYTPWLYGEVGNNSEAAKKWGPEILNAQYVGTDGKGNPDDKGAEMLGAIAKWNGDDDEVGGSSKSGSKAWDDDEVSKIPYLRLWANDLCHEDGDQNFRVCWGPDTGYFSDDQRQVHPEDETTIKISSGNDFMARLSAAAMSVMGGIIINCTVYFVCAMLLAAKLGVFVLMVFAPLYLMLGMFPGPSRVAAIKLGELLLANVFRQVGWSLGLVIITYMDTLILAPGGDQNWVLKILTCALMTIMFGVYARPTMRALSGMAMGDKEAGGAIEGVGADMAQKAAKGSLAIGLAAATGGVSAAMAVQGASAAAAASGQSLSAAEGFKAAGMGFAKAFPNLGRRTRTALQGREHGRESFENSQQRAEEKERTELLWRSPAAREGMAKQRRRDQVTDPVHDAAKEAIDERRANGEERVARDLERMHYDALRDRRTGARHSDDPLHPQNLRRDAMGSVDPRRNVRPTTGGQELMSEHGLSNLQQAAANLDRLMQAYGNLANIDPNHGAALPLRSLAIQVESGEANTSQARFAAAQAVQRYGVPDRIDAVGMPSSAPVRVEFRQLAGDLNRAPLQADASPRQRMEFLVRVEEMARQVPVGTTMSTALNDLRGVVANMKAPQEQLDQALQAVQRAAATQNGSGS